MGWPSAGLNCRNDKIPPGPAQCAVPRARVVTRHPLTPTSFVSPFNYCLRPFQISQRLPHKNSTFELSSFPGQAMDRWDARGTDCLKAVKTARRQPKAIFPNEAAVPLLAVRLISHNCLHNNVFRVINEAECHHGSAAKSQKNAPPGNRRGGFGGGMIIRCIRRPRDQSRYRVGAGSRRCR